MPSCLFHFFEPPKILHAVDKHSLYFSAATTFYCAAIYWLPWSESSSMPAQFSLLLRDSSRNKRCLCSARTPRASGREMRATFTTALAQQQHHLQLPHITLFPRYYHQSIIYATITSKHALPHHSQRSIIWSMPHNGLMTFRYVDALHTLSIDASSTYYTFLMHWYALILRRYCNKDAFGRLFSRCRFSSILMIGHASAGPRICKHDYFDLAIQKNGHYYDLQHNFYVVRSTFWWYMLKATFTSILAAYASHEITSCD